MTLCAFDPEVEEAAALRLTGREEPTLGLFKVDGSVAFLQADAGTFSVDESLVCASEDESGEGEDEVGGGLLTRYLFIT